jgi:hypothetical protein
MSGNGRELGSEQILALFAALSDRLAASGTHAHIFIVGGAAMALAYDPRRVTRDVDGIFAPVPEVRQAVRDVATVEGLEDDWLNDAAKGFMPGGDKHPRTVFESEHLLVQVPSEEYLLSMKLYSARVDSDFDDAATLYTAWAIPPPERASNFWKRPTRPACYSRVTATSSTTSSSALRHDVINTDGHRAHRGQASARSRTPRPLLCRRRRVPAVRTSSGNSGQRRHNLRAPLPAETSRIPPSGGRAADPPGTASGAAWHADGRLNRRPRMETLMSPRLLRASCPRVSRRG